MFVLHHRALGSPGRDCELDVCFTHFNVYTGDSGAAPTFDKIQMQNPDHPRMLVYQKWTWSMTWPSSSVKSWLRIKRLTMALLSLPQLLILFDHLLLAVLFLVALFCILAAVTSNMQVPLSTWGMMEQVDDDDDHMRACWFQLFPLTSHQPPTRSDAWWHFLQNRQQRVNNGGEEVGPAGEAGVQVWPGELGHGGGHRGGHEVIEGRNAQWKRDHWTCHCQRSWSWPLTKCPCEEKVKAIRMYFKIWLSHHAFCGQNCSFIAYD